VSERTELRTTFDSVAEAYDRVRPAYPEALFDALVAATGLRPGDRALEIGPATGKALRPMAARGIQVTAIELGAELAARARTLLAGVQPAPRIIHGDFDTWTPEAGERFDLVYAATAWHWPDPATKYARAAARLRPGGHLAFWAALQELNAHSDPFFAEIQEVYDAIGAGRPEHHGPPGERLPDQRAEIEASGRFDVVCVERFLWERRYDAEEYIALIDTFSSHIAMTPAQRATLYGEIRARLGARPDGRVRREWGSVLHVARRRD
jgi:SAM-dependent methyltransferase